MKNTWILIIAILVVAIIIIYYNNYLEPSVPTISKRLNGDKTLKSITYTLPTVVDPTQFGPYWWSALHDFVSEIPCVACREKAVSFQRYFHDLVNRRLEKPIFDKENFDYWTNYIKDIDVKK
jgi:hypothetical protein